MQPVSGSAAARNCVAPDEIDRIIQEYRNLNRVPLPARSDFVTEHSSAHFDESELNTSDYSHFIPGVMTEIVTEEASFDGDVRGQLSIYHVDPQLGVERRFRRNGYLEHINFLRVFRTDGIPYLVIDSGRRALSVFRLVPSSRGYDLVAQRLDRFELFWEAIRTTMAYIAEDQAYIRFDDELNPEVVPAADFRAPMPVDDAR